VIKETTQPKIPASGSQSRMIYDYMMQGNTLTSIEAVREFGILRLPNRIGDLVKTYHQPLYAKEHRKGRTTWKEYGMFPFDGAERIDG